MLQLQTLSHGSSTGAISPPVGDFGHQGAFVTFSEFGGQFNSLRGAIPRQVIQKNDIFSPSLSDFDKIRQSDKTFLSDCKKLIFFLIGQLEKKL